MCWMVLPLFKTFPFSSSSDIEASSLTDYITGDECVNTERTLNSAQKIEPPKKIQHEECPYLEDNKMQTRIHGFVIKLS
jgi:hypothetical protein